MDTKLTTFFIIFLDGNFSPFWILFLRFACFKVTGEKFLTIHDRRATWMNTKVYELQMQLKINDSMVHNFLWDFFDLFLQIFGKTVATEKVVTVENFRPSLLIIVLQGFLLNGLKTRGKSLEGKSTGLNENEHHVLTFFFGRNWISFHFGFYFGKRKSSECDFNYRKSWRNVTAKTLFLTFTFTVWSIFAFAKLVSRVHGLNLLNQRII